MTFICDCSILIKTFLTPNICQHSAGTAWPKMHVHTRAKVKADFVMLSCMYCKNAVKIGLGNVVLYKWKETPRAFCTSAIFPRIFPLEYLISFT